MCPKRIQKRWWRKYMKMIHEYDQCKQLAADLEAVGNPKSQHFERLADVYKFLMDMAQERSQYYKNKTAL